VVIATVDLQRKHRATLCRLAVDMDHAGPALAGIAADVGAGKPQLIAQELNE